MRIFRSELYEQLENEEYVTLARMKGMGTRRLMVRHVAKNSGFGLITVLAVSSGALIAGAVILENIFAIPGIGSLILQGVQNRDAPVVEGCLAVVAVVIVVFNLLADIAYMLVDPRVRDAANWSADESSPRSLAPRFGTSSMEGARLRAHRDDAHERAR